MMSLQRTASISDEPFVRDAPASVVKRLDAGEGARWDAFVNAASGGTFYHLSGWRSVIENHLRHTAYYLYCETGCEIEAVLPLVHVKSMLFGNALISVPFLVYGGPIGSNPAAVKLVIGAAQELASELGVDHLEFRNQAPIEGNWYTKSSYATFRKRIDPEPEANLIAIPRKQRAMIRKGIKAGLKAEIDHDTNRLYAAMLACKRNLGTPFFGASWLRAINDEFGDQVEIITVTHKKKTVCSVMSFRHNDEIMPYYGGGGEMARDLKGNDFMYWAVMEKACQDGVKIFDFGRSSVGSGAYRFKKHWGFEPELLSYQHHFVAVDDVPNLSPHNPKYRFLIKMWKRLPLWLAGLIGPGIARSLG